MIQLLAHLFGDYILQSDWMALNKRKDFWPAWTHATIYALCFFPLVMFRHNGWIVLAVIQVTHFLIDHFGLARYVVWAKNFIAPWERIRTFHEIIADFKTSGIGLNGTMTAAEVGEVIAEQKRPIRVNPPWRACVKTGYSPDRPDWMAVWLLIIADNTLHLACNYLALRYL